VMPTFFASPTRVITAAILLRVALLLYGLVQDTLSPIKYTDIDYLVFTDAARFLSPRTSPTSGPPYTPYRRHTYRYTPLLAWLLFPTTCSPRWLWFSFGKVLFAAGDVVAGVLIAAILRKSKDKGGLGMDTEIAMRFAAVWLLNPMVAQISTRGSAEGLVDTIVVALLWAVLERRVKLAGVLLGLAVHVKIYPFIYGGAVLWWMDEERMGPISSSRRTKGKKKLAGGDGDGLVQRVIAFFTPVRIMFVAWSLCTFILLNTAMYALYGRPFLQHTYFYHFTRLDHRHNFSPYNTLLYLSSAPSSSFTANSLHLESLAFLPQLLLSAFLIPLALAKKDLPATLLAQTFAFVTFNKVCTSQYFLWYLVFLPFYLPRSSLLERRRLGVLALSLWIAGQAVWLQQGFQLEFLGQSTFVPGLWAAGLGFFVVNCWILGVVIGDV
ncbi:GPI mannosyltransferase 1, partial [Lineolata rhizophorae]